MLSVDLDHFKEANDVFGHVVGDELLCAIARRLRSPPEGTFVARVGGDEFTLIVDRGQHRRPREPLAKRLLRSGRRRFEIRGQQIPIGLSIGAAVYPQRRHRRATLLANADAALYRAKADGRERFAFSTPRWTGACASAMRCSTTCARPSRMASCSSHYQPQAKIDGEVFGFEALVRWQHPEHGLVPPGTFIPLAEQNGTDRRDRRLGAARSLPRGRFLARRRCRSPSTCRRSSSATAICRGSCTRSCSRRGWRRAGWSWRSPKAS